MDKFGWTKAHLHTFHHLSGKQPSDWKKQHMWNPCTWVNTGINIPWGTNCCIRQGWHQVRCAESLLVVMLYSPWVLSGTTDRNTSFPFYSQVAHLSINSFKFSNRIRENTHTYPDFSLKHLAFEKEPFHNWDQWNCATWNMPGSLQHCCKCITQFYGNCLGWGRFWLLVDGYFHCTFLHFHQSEIKRLFLQYVLKQTHKLEEHLKEYAQRHLICWDISRDVRNTWWPFNWNCHYA